MRSTASKTKQYAEAVIQNVKVLGCLVSYRGSIGIHGLPFFHVYVFWLGTGESELEGVQGFGWAVTHAINTNTHTHTHQETHIYMYIITCVYERERERGREREREGERERESERYIYIYIELYVCVSDTYDILRFFPDNGLLPCKVSRDAAFRHVGS